MPRLQDLFHALPARKAEKLQRHQLQKPDPRKRTGPRPAPSHVWLSVRSDTCESTRPCKAHRAGCTVNPGAGWGGEHDIISSLVARQPEKASPCPDKLLAAPKAETIVLLLTSFPMNEQTQRSAVRYYTQCVCRELMGVGSYN